MVAPGARMKAELTSPAGADSDTPNNSKCDKVLSFSVSSKIAVEST